MFEAALVAIGVIVLVVILLLLLFAVAVGLAIGIPTVMLIQWWRKSSARTLTQKPMDRLQNLYVDGKIDLFEYEKRVAALVSTEH